MRRIIKWILDTLFPPHCVSCKTEGDFLCKKCVQELRKRKISQRVRLPAGRPREFSHLAGVIHALDYAENPAIKAAIEQFKYKFNQELAVYFGSLIAEKIGELAMAKNRPICLIPVPLHRRRLFYRGFNQAELIARAVRDKMPGKNICILPLLCRVKHTTQQAKLTRRDRLQNMESAFSMNKKFVHKSARQWALYFIVDDVCTTGATLENCAAVLKENGFERVYGLVVARAFK